MVAMEDACTESAPLELPPVALGEALPEREGVLLAPDEAGLLVPAVAPEVGAEELAAAEEEPAGRLVKRAADEYVTQLDEAGILGV